MTNKTHTLDAIEITDAGQLQPITLPMDDSFHRWVKTHYLTATAFEAECGFVRVHSARREPYLDIVQIDLGFFDVCYIARTLAALDHAIHRALEMAHRATILSDRSTQPVVEVEEE